MPVISDLKKSVKIVDFRFLLIQQQIIVELMTDFVDSEGTIVLSQTGGTIIIERDDALPLITAMADGTKSIYENVKTVTYNYLVAKNIVSGEVV